MTDTTQEKVQPAAPQPPGRKASWLRRILVGLLLVFIAMQFFQPGKDNLSRDMQHDISTVVTVPDSVHSLLKQACYDCHSNYTNYPWYANIQPIGWWLKDHIEEGKQHLNFQEFALVQPRPNSPFNTVRKRQDHKLEEVLESQEDEWMPLKSYTWIHAEARLTKAQRQMLIDWVKQARSELMAAEASDSAAAVM